MAVQAKDVREGSIIVVCPGFGNHRPITATVTAIDNDDERGEVVTYADEDGDGVWAYMSQIQRVVKY